MDDNDQARNGEADSRGDGPRPDGPGVLELRRAYPALALLAEATAAADPPDCSCGHAGPDEFGNYDQIVDPACPLHGVADPMPDEAALDTPLGALQREQNRRRVIDILTGDDE